MAKKKKNNFAETWTNAIQNMKIRDVRIFNVEDTERENPYKFNGWLTDFVTGDDMVSIYNIKEGKSYVMNSDYFNTFFEKIEIEY